MEELYTTKDYCDIILKTGGEELHAHRIVLSSKSPVFKKKIKDDNTGIISIQDHHDSTVKKYLKYIYCNELEEMTFDETIALMDFSHDYDNFELKILCVQRALHLANDENICKIYLVGKTLQLERMCSFATNYITEKASTVFSTENFVEFLKKNREWAAELLSKIGGKLNR